MGLRDNKHQILRSTSYKVGKRKEFLDVFNSDQNCFDSNNQDISHDLKASTVNLQCLKNCIPRP